MCRVIACVLVVASVLVVEYVLAIICVLTVECVFVIACVLTAVFDSSNNDTPHSHVSITESRLQLHKIIKNVSVLISGQYI